MMGPRRIVVDSGNCLGQSHVEHTPRLAVAHPQLTLRPFRLSPVAVAFASSTGVTSWGLRVSCASLRPLGLSFAPNRPL